MIQVEMETKKQIEIEMGIKGEYEVEDNFSMKICMTAPYSLCVNIELPSGTFKNEEEIENNVKHDLEYLYYSIETIKLDFEEFEKLSANYSALESGLHIQMYNKKFYSSYEEERYRKELNEKLEKGYNELYDKYITDPRPLFKTFKDKLEPSILSTLIKAIQEKENNHEQ